MCQHENADNVYHTTMYKNLVKHLEGQHEIKSKDLAGTPLLEMSNAERAIARRSRAAKHASQRAAIPWDVAVSGARQPEPAVIFSSETLLRITAVPCEGLGGHVDVMVKGRNGKIWKACWMECNRAGTLLVDPASITPMDEGDFAVAATEATARQEARRIQRAVPTGLPSSSCGPLVAAASEVATPTHPMQSYHSQAVCFTADHSAFNTYKGDVTLAICDVNDDGLAAEHDAVPLAAASLTDCFSERPAEPLPSGFGRYDYHPAAGQFQPGTANRATQQTFIVHGSPQNKRQKLMPEFAAGSSVDKAAKDQNDAKDNDDNTNGADNEANQPTHDKPDTKGGKDPDVKEEPVEH